MKISELNDEDVLNFLMTSEFTEGDYSPAEFKYLLTKVSSYQMEILS